MAKPITEELDCHQYETPQGEFEEKLANVWRNLLHTESVGRHDNFFALGGSYLLAIQLLGSLKQIGLNTTMQEVFYASNLSILASKLTHHQEMTIPPNSIVKNSTEITPEMLPLITLSQAEIDAIIKQVPGGVANIQDIYGLTPFQSGILHRYLVATESNLYLTTSQIRFINRTLLDRYADAIQQLIERHDILRTAIFWNGLSEPVQIVLRQVPSFITEITCNESNISALEQLSTHPHRNRLDLHQASLLHLLAAPTSGNSWVALQLTPHLIIDHLTLKRLQAEINGIMDGKTELLEIPTPFRNFVAKSRSDDSKSTENCQFFINMLGDIDEPTLPFGLCDIDPDGHDIDEAHLNLPQTLNDQLRTHARNLHVNLASICHLACAQLIAKTSGREAVVFGTVLLGEENKNIMGPTINTLPLRLNIDKRSIEAAVRDTYARLSTLLAYEHTSLILAQNCSGVPAGSLLFGALLSYRHNQKIEELYPQLPGVTFLNNVEQTTYPLMLSMDDDDIFLCMSVKTVSSLSATRICAYMLQSLESLTTALSYTPHQPVQKLSVIPMDERNLLLHSWNQRTVIDSPVCCLHQLFETQMVCDGQAVAVEYNLKSLTYSELNAQANRLAHYIISQGVKPDDRIVLCVERSIAMIVAMLGILKAGCTYVPLDPAYASQRLTNILLDSDPSFLIADETGRNALGDHKVSVIDLEEQLYSDFSIDNPNTSELGLTPANLAYIIYTSGSTGTPKGVMVEHQQVVRHLMDTNDQFDFSQQDKWCLFHSISYDMSLSVIWGSLLCGGQLSILPYNILHSSDKFYDWICGKGISVFIQTPSLFKTLLRANDFILRVDHLRYVMFGGEVLDLMILKDWYEKYDNGKTVLVQRYGSTETVMIVRACICSKTFSRKREISIGQPTPNKPIYLLDTHCEPVPLGAEGEIYVGGIGMARGYLDRPDLTAERFLPDPFSEYPVARMYRTGDRARYLPDGNLIFLGRLDQQVKIRGFRIELGEIETRLIEHPRVMEAVVQVYGKGSDAYLVAYVVANTNEFLAQNLRTYLLNLLPHFMVPSAYVPLHSLPLTANGKLNRRALPPPNDEAYDRQNYEAPRGEMEENLAKIWRKVLSIDRISRHDNFFALGGHSLLAMKLLTQLRQIGLDTTVREVFDASSLAMLAYTLTSYKAAAIPPNLITKESTKITPEMLPLITLSQADIGSIIAQIPGGVANIQDIYGLTPLQDGVLFHHLMAKESDPYLIKVKMSFIDRTSLERYVDALNKVIERHDILRTAIIWEDVNEPAQVVLRHSPSLLNEPTLDVVDIPISQRLSQYLSLHLNRLNLKQAPLLRLIAAPEFEGTWIAFQLMHHTIMDHTTLERLKIEIHAFMDGKIELLATPTPFRQFVAQIRLGFSATEHTVFFTDMLSNIYEPIMPFGLSGLNHCEETTISLANFKLSQKLNHHLRVHAQNLRASLSSLCHLAWATVLSKASGREAVVFGTVLLGRLMAGTENDSAMGPTINTLALRLDINEASVENSVRSTHTRLSALLTHGHVPLVFAQRCSGVPANLSLINTLFNYRHSQKTEQIAALMPGVSFLGSNGQTNYPLTMSLDDNDDDLCLSVQVASPISAARICAYMQQSLQSLADALTNTSQESIQKMTVIPPEERTILLHTWNQTIVTHATVSCLHHLFEAQVESDGEVIALEYNGQSSSYSEVNMQSNRLAHYLIAQGVKPDDRIVICTERSVVMIVAMLGILKTGCAYVPLDPTYSSQRLTNTLLDANPKLLLADATGRNALGDHQVTIIDLEKPLPTNLPADNPNVSKLGLVPAHLAYVIYTSGSTGTPKGVMVEHRQVVRLFEVSRNKFNFNRKDKWSSFSSISFDMSVLEIFNSLFNGGQLSIAPYNIILSAEEFYNWICTRGITVLNQTPSALKVLISAKNFCSLSHRLRYVFIGGEAMDLSIVRDWNEKHKNNETVLYNLYGPTEAAVFAASRKIEFSQDIVCSIGRPLPDLCVYLLDSLGALALLGTEGEIYIGGAGVARGYLNRSEFTAERFLPDPFSESPIARMYRTGDLARYLPDGNLIFLGRIDQQVKIRGFRIELGEIENQLNDHSQIQESVVLARDDSKGNKRLIAYLVSAPNNPIQELLEIRQYLHNRLPDYMIPAAFVSINKLPLMQSGKLDSKALPEPNENAFLHQPYEEPISDLERIIADIWQTLLEVDKVGRHDHFFELGGHSLLAISAVNLINRDIGDDYKIRVSDIFAAPTVVNLAKRVKSQNRSSELVDLEKTAILPSDIQPLSINNNEPGNAILLTGATGFVGRFLLRELLDTSLSKIYCIVRGRDQTDSVQRLMDIMSKWCLWREGDELRLIVLHGDIKQERFGLDEQIYNRLCTDVSIIFHLAVSMNHLESFDMAHQANIMGLIELLRFATQRTNKIMNFASTMSIFRRVDQIGHRVVNETSIIRNERHYADQGYVASKWVGEEIVNLAIARGIACNIFRLGLITADSELARYDELQSFYRLFKSCIQMEMTFVDFDEGIQLTPVDFTAKALAHLGLMHNSSENVFHLSAMDRISRSDFIEHINEHLPRPMAMVSHRQWLQEARQRYHQGEMLPITPLIQDVMMSSDEELEIFYKSMKETTINFDSTKTLDKLNQSDIKIPTASHKWYRLFADSLIK